MSSSHALPHVLDDGCHAIKYSLPGMTSSHTLLHVWVDGCHAIKYSLPDISSSYVLPACLESYLVTDTCLRGNRHRTSVEYVQEMRSL
ncbi:hypothetical protein J6590_103106, partial [Homalodisca vitripennis]